MKREGERMNKHLLLSSSLSYSLILCAPIRK